MRRKKIRQVKDDLIIDKIWFYEIVEVRSAKDLPTTYKNIATLLDGYKRPIKTSKNNIKATIKTKSNKE